jgi:putative ABC transport system permease protein
VIRVERQRAAPVRLRAGRASRETSITVVSDGASLRRIVDLDGRQIALPAKGLLLSRTLARVLGLEAGDWVDVEVLEGRRPRVRLPVASLVDDSFGLNAYVREGPFLEATLEPSLASELFLRVDRARLDEVSSRLSRFPAVIGVTRPQVARDLFRRQTAEVFLTYQFVLAAFAFVIAVGVVYNNARIALVTRSRDLASLRILGFSREQVGAVLLGEQVVQLALGVPLGLPLGQGLVHLALSSTDPELYRLPAAVSAQTLASAAVLVLLAGMVSALLVRRGLRHLDLVAVLKARD